MKLKFIKMKKPLKWEVKDGKKVVLKPGARNISIAFRASPRWYVDPITCKKTYFNVYKKPDGTIIHGY